MLTVHHKSPRRFTSVLFYAAIVCVCGLGGCDNGGAGDEAEFPRKPIKVIVPFGAGGGSDTFGRIIQHAIAEHDLLKNFVIINVPGAGGTIGSRRVKNARPDGYTILLLHEGILTAKHSGQAAYGPEAFEAIAGTGNAPQVVAVAGDSPHRDLKSLMAATSAEPDSVVFSANIGAPSHFAGLMLEGQQADARFRYTQTGGGAKRFAAILGGHADVSSFSIAEYVQFRDSGLRALALLGPERNAELPELATAREQGFDVISQNMQFWWAPLGTPPSRIELLASVIGEAMRKPEVIAKLTEMSTSSVVLVGETLEKEIARRDDRIAAVSPRSPQSLPNFPIYVLGAVLVLAAVAVWRNLPRQTGKPSVPVNTRLGAVVVGSMAVYIAVLQFRVVSFIPATALFALVCGACLALPRLAESDRGQRHRIWIALVAMILLMSVVTHHVFTRILVVDLP